MTEKLKLTPEQREIQKERTFSDAELLGEGAEYSEKGTLMPTNEQIEEIRKKHQEEVEEALIKTYTDFVLSYSGTDERVLSDKELLLSPKQHRSGGPNVPGAEYIIGEISGQVILEVGRQLQLELSSNEKAEDAVNRLLETLKKLKLRRGDTVTFSLRDNSTTTGYLDPSGGMDDDPDYFKWSEDKKHAYIYLAHSVNQGQGTFGLGGTEMIPAQAIERIELVRKRKSWGYV